jgi:transcriptional regulator with XRE-family HTH domain
MQGPELRAARLAAGLSAREIAEAVGVSSRSIERVEADHRRVRPATYQRHLEAARRVLSSRLDALDRLAGTIHQ